MKYVLERLSLRYKVSRYYFFDNAEDAKEKVEWFEYEDNHTLPLTTWITNSVKEISNEKEMQMKHEMERFGGNEFWIEPMPELKKYFQRAKDLFDEI